jgi:Spy/CpxP family protein refolding chaperone
MWKNLKILAIVFSVGLNIAFIGSHLLRMNRLPWAAQGAKCQYLYEELNLSPSQLAHLQPLRDQFHAFLAAQGKRLKSRRLELISLLAGGAPKEQVAAKQREIQVLQQQLQSKVIEHFNAESRIFTPSQRHKFFDLIKERIKQSDNAHPKWMPHRGRQR